MRKIGALLRYDIGLVVAIAIVFVAVLIVTIKPGISSITCVTVADPASFTPPEGYVALSPGDTCYTDNPALVRRNQ